VRIAVLCWVVTDHPAVTLLPPYGAGCALVVHEMLAFPETHAIQGFGCNALAHLAYSMPPNIAAITAAGGVEVVMVALRAHADVDSIEPVCLGALVNLAEAQDARTCASAATGAGGDNGIAKLWNRREISASSDDDQSHYLHPHPYEHGSRHGPLSMRCNLVRICTQGDSRRRRRGACNIRDGALHAQPGRQQRRRRRRRARARGGPSGRGRS
jgi:hypothetical protein